MYYSGCFCIRVIDNFAVLRPPTIITVVSSPRIGSRISTINQSAATSSSIHSQTPSKSAGVMERGGLASWRRALGGRLAALTLLGEVDRHSRNAQHTESPLVPCRTPVGAWVWAKLKLKVGNGRCGRKEARRSSGVPALPSAFGAHATYLLLPVLSLSLSPPYHNNFGFLIHLFSVVPHSFRALLSLLLRTFSRPPVRTHARVRKASPFVPVILPNRHNEGRFLPHSRLGGLGGVCHSGWYSDST